MADVPLTARKYFDGVYIPAGLLVFGTFIVKKEWTPYAALVAVILSVWKFNSLRTCYFNDTTLRFPMLTRYIEPKKVLKPDVFQEFELKEKTIVSHNVAMSVIHRVAAQFALLATVLTTSSYRFKLPAPNALLGLPIGQHISIGASLPQPDGTTKEIVRSYTPISGDHQPGYFDLLIKSYPTGNISKHLASLAVGQTIKVRGPKGAFVYTPNMVRHFGMVAGGTGITPMLQVVRAIIRGRPTGDKTQVDLIFANVSPQDILLKEDLDQLAKEDSGFKVHYVLDKPPEGWTGGVGYVTADMVNVSASFSLECLR
jgi:cytochrome-b5 reductase